MKNNLQFRPGGIVTLPNGKEARLPENYVHKIDTIILFDDNEQPILSDNGDGTVSGFPPEFFNNEVNIENPSHSFTEGADIPQSVGEEMTNNRFNEEQVNDIIESQLDYGIKRGVINLSNPQPKGWVKEWALQIPKDSNAIQEFPALNKVAEFQKNFNFPILANPEIPSHERCNLRYNLLEEELEELRVAMVAKDIVAVADALADLQYVLSGAVLEFGLQGRFGAILEEVHRSNMSKACKTQKEAEDTIARYKREQPDAYHMEEREGLFYVYRSRDMKLIKSIYYSPADILGILHDTERSRS